MSSRTPSARRGSRSGARSSSNPVASHVSRHALQSRAIYSELLELLAVAELSGLIAKGGSLQQRKVKGRAYWYLRRRVGNRIGEKYLGPETEELLGRLEKVQSDADDAKRAAQGRRGLIRMLRSAGYTETDRRVGRVLEEFAEAGVFRLEGVLVGTFAFRCYGALLGVRFGGEHAITNDIDIAQASGMRVAVGTDSTAGVAEALARAEKFTAIPDLDPRSPPTSWHTKDHQLRVDVLTPLVGRTRESAVRLPLLRTHATALRFLDFLLVDTVRAAALTGSGVLVRVPSPERFAIHKLIVSQRRSSAFRDKSSKDLAQAQSLIEVLVEDRPDDMADLWEELATRGKSWVSTARKAVGQLSPDVSERFLAAVAAGSN